MIANDSDNKRCYLMVHQVRRLASSNFLVMNNDAAILPSFTTQVRLINITELQCTEYGKCLRTVMQDRHIMMAMIMIIFTAQGYARVVLGVVILSVRLSVTRVDCDKTK